MQTEERVSTGIKELDNLIQGGYKKYSINLIEGGPGSGKTILATHFLIEGLKNNEKCMYITFELNKEKYYSDMKTLGWDLESYEKKGLFVFLAYTPEQIKNVLVEGGGTLDTTITKNKIKRLVIDSITSFALLYPTELAKKESALSLFNMINSWKCTTILTAQAEEDKEHGSPVFSAALDFEVEGIILLYHPISKGIRKRGLEILKMRGTKHPNKIYEIDITPEGIKIKDSILTI
jgi:circadian clock protein KaiC